jgi:hypothetical protein
MTSRLKLSNYVRNMLTCSLTGSIPLPAKATAPLQNMAPRMLSARAVSRVEAARVVGSRVTGTAALVKASAETVGATT